MSNRVSSAVLCLVVALAMAFGPLLPHPTHSTSHDMAALAAPEQEEDERVAGHSPGHNPADHSHETPTTPPGIAAAVPPLLRTWLPMPPQTAHLGASYRLERPPRPIVIA